MTRYHVHIGRLTLEGKSRAEGRRIVAALERHLTVLANQGRAAGPVEAGPLAHGAGADAIGSRIAAQVYRKLGGARHV